MAKLSDYVDQGSSTSEIKLLDSITTSATATYALTKNGTAYSPDSARNLIVSLNGVTQAPQDAYTVSGSNIVFDSALTSVDVIDYILVIGSAISIGTPSDGTVGTAQMSYPLGNFSSTGIDDNATSTAITIDSNEDVTFTKNITAEGLYLNQSASPSDNTILRITGGTSGYSTLHFADTDDVNVGSIQYNHSSNYITFGVNDLEQVRIRDSYLLVGTTSTTINTSNFGVRIGVVGHEGKIAAHRNAGGGSACQVFGGNVGELFIMGDGDVRNTNNSYGGVSDERLKSNIVDATNQLDDIMSVQVRSYTLDSTGDTHIGVVAQELEASGMSGLVDEDEEGMKSVKYSVLYMKAIKALQEAVTRIGTLEAEVAALKAGDT